MLRGMSDLVLPRLLDPANHQGAIDALTRYYGTIAYADQKPYTGAYFDTWDTTGTRAADANRFTADDLVAVSMLSVSVPSPAAIELLGRRAGSFSELLQDLGPDRDLVEEKEEWPKDWAGARLWDELMSLPGVGATTASKLFARKRPRLRPIYDSVVASVIGSRQIWRPLRVRLQSDADLHDRLLRLKCEAGLPDDVSAVRVFDVVTWMEGKAAGIVTHEDDDTTH